MAKCFVGGLSWDTTEIGLKSYFERYGAVREAILINDKQTGKPRGFGFVTFELSEVANLVAGKYHEIDGKNVDVKVAVPREESVATSQNTRIAQMIDSVPRKVFVGGLRTDAEDVDLHAAFKRFGEIETTTVMRDKISGLSRRFGFVIFKDHSSVEKCVGLQDIIVRGRKCEARYAEVDRCSGDDRRGDDDRRSDDRRGDDRRGGDRRGDDRRGFDDRRGGHGSRRSRSRSRSRSLSRERHRSDGYGNFNNYNQYNGYDPRSGMHPSFYHRGGDANPYAPSAYGGYPPPHDAIPQYNVNSGGIVDLLNMYFQPQQMPPYAGGPPPSSVNPMSSVDSQLPPRDAWPSAYGQQDYYGGRGPPTDRKPLPK